MYLSQSGFVLEDIEPTQWVPTTGKNLREAKAYYSTEVMEKSAKIYSITKSVGQARCLTEEEYKVIQGLEREAYRVNLLQKMN